MMTPEVKPLFQKTEVSKVLRMWLYDDPVVDYIAQCDWFYLELLEGKMLRVEWEKGYSWEDKTTKCRATIRAATSYTKYEEDPAAVGLLEWLFQEEVLKRVFGEEKVCFHGVVHKGVREDYRFALLGVDFNGKWLGVPDVTAVANALSIDTLPALGNGYLEDGVKLLREPPKSVVTGKTILGALFLPEVPIKDSKGDFVIRCVTEVDMREYQDYYLRSAFGGV